jgi:hypothetical protein
MLMVLRPEQVGPGTSRWDLMHCVMKASVLSGEKQRHLSYRRSLIHTAYQDCIIPSLSKPKAIQTNYSSNPYVGSCAPEQIISHYIRVET